MQTRLVVLDRSSGEFTLATATESVTGSAGGGGNSSEFLGGGAGGAPDSPRRTKPDHPLASDSITRTFAQTVNRELRLSMESAKTRATLEELTLNKLNWKEVGIVGRQDQLNALYEIFQRRESRPKIVVISGPSGTGKSTLALELRRCVRSGPSRGFYSLGKFDQSLSSEPYRALGEAFSGMVDQILSLDEEEQQRIRTVVHEALGEDCHLLLTFVPNLSKLIPQLSSESESAVTDGCNLDSQSRRLEHSFQRLVLALLKCEVPMVMVLDDLQWADSSSMNLVHTLVRELNEYSRKLEGNTSSSFVLVMTCRDDETDQDHPFARAINRWHEDRDPEVHRLHLEDLDTRATQALINLALRLSEDDPSTAALSAVVHRKTGGNAFFVREFLKTLVDENILSYNFGPMLWTWDETRVQSALATDNVAALLTRRLRLLPPASQVALQIAACLGHSFHTSHLFAVLDVAQNHLAPASKGISVAAVEENLAALVSDGFLDQTGDNFSFVHDQIQMAALELIPSSHLTGFKLCVGQQLLTVLDVSCFSSMEVAHGLFLAVDLCNEGAAAVAELDKPTLAKHSLRAGELALQKSAFAAALKYMAMGIRYVGDDNWSDYDLMLRLRTGAMEVAYCQADFESMSGHMDSILSRDIPIDDKVRAYTVRISYLGSCERYMDALSVACSVLRDLGLVTLPLAPSLFKIVKELGKTKRMVKDHSVSTLLALPMMEDPRRIAAMGILDKMATFAYLCNEKLLLLLFLLAMQWTLKYGLCEYSPYVITCYGFILILLGDDPNRAYMFGETGIALVERLNVKVNRSKTVRCFYAFVHIRTRDMRAAIKPLLFGYQIGMESGDIESAMLNLSHHDMYLFLTASRPLKELTSQMEEHHRLMSRYKQDHNRTFHSIFWQTALNLIGSDSSVDPVDLTGKAMEEGAMRQLLHDTKNKTMINLLDEFKSQLAYLFHAAPEVAWDYSTRANPIAAKGSSMTIRHYFFNGLIAMSMARCRPFTYFPYIRSAVRNLRYLQKLATSGNRNCLHMIPLLKAELAAFRNRPSKAKELYRESIYMASRAGYLQDKALAHERAAAFQLSYAGKGAVDRIAAASDDDGAFWAELHLEEAILGYQEWGAQAMVDHLVRTYQGHLSEKSSREAVLPPQT